MSSDKSKVELEASGSLIEKRQSVRHKELVPDIANIDKVSNVELPAAISNDIEKNCANPTNPIEVTRSEPTGSTNATDASCSLATSSTTRDKENIDKIQRQTNNDSGVDSAGTDTSPNTSKNLPSQPTYSNAPNKLRNPNSNPVMNGSSPASLTSPDGTRSSSNSENLSKTNLYIRGLASSTTDEDLYNMCAKYGTIFSTKAIFDKTTGCCKGYGFVQYTTPQSAESAVIELNKNGVLAQMARIPTFHSSQDQHYGHNHHSNNNHHNNSQPGHGNHQSQFHRNNHNYNIGSAGLSNQQQSQDVMNNQHNHADPTNLYIANLPPNMSEEELSTLLSSYGPVISTRILRDERNMTRRVGFARMETSDKCQEVIEELNGLLCKGCTEPLLVKFADGGNRKRHHHNNHRHFNNRHMHHHRYSQEDHRWREELHTNNSSNMSSFEQHGNISHCNQATDLAMMGTVGYPRMPQPFPPSMNPGQGYHGQTTSPQWVHPGGQPWGVISPQMMQPGSLGTPNQAPVASAAYPYAHLASQMQGLQISHHGAHMAGYLQPHHQWPAVWPQPMPRHHHPPSVRMSRHQDDVSTLQAQQTLKQHSSESAVNEPDMQRGYQHKLSINVGDSAEKPQVSTPM